MDLEFPYKVVSKSESLPKIATLEFPFDHASAVLLSVRAFQA